MTWAFLCRLLRWIRQTVLVATTAGVMTIAGLSLNSPVASTAADLEALPFGFPVRWVTQDYYHGVDGFPARVSFSSPKELTTTVHADRLTECHTIWLAAVIAVVVLVMLLRAADGRRRRRRFEWSAGASGRGGTS